MGVFLDDVVLDVRTVVDWFEVWIFWVEQDGEFFQRVVFRSDGLLLVPWNFVLQFEWDAFEFVSSALNCLILLMELPFSSIAIRFILAYGDGVAEISLRGILFVIAIIDSDGSLENVYCWLEYNGRVMGIETTIVNRGQT